MKTSPWGELGGIDLEICMLEHGRCNKSQRNPFQTNVYDPDMPNRFTESTATAAGNLNIDTPLFGGGTASVDECEHINIKAEDNHDHERREEEVITKR